MYKDHPAFACSNDDSTKIWRYLDFTKFVSLLDTKSLFYSRADKLPDSFEGSYTKVNQIYREDALKNSTGIAYDLWDNISSIARELRKYMHINCWHINEYESEAMWQIFLQSNEGVAIQSTIGKLKRSFHISDEIINIGEVHYIDYEKHAIPLDNIFNPFLRKRKSFEHERELRAICFTLQNQNENISINEDIQQLGTYVPVDLEILIENIFVSPASQDWFYDLTHSITSKYGIGKKPIQSILNDNPIY